VSTHTPTLGALAVLLAGCASGPQLRPGEVAPPFTLPGSDGKSYRLADYRGREVVVLAWFPKAFTGG
jgi:peroxiredoxin Q/BCP